METIINGVLLDEVISGYTTANVENRYTIAPILETVEIPGRDGVVVLGQKYPPRNLVVHYVLKANNAKEFAERMKQLNKLIQTKGTVPFSFSDEGGFFREGRLSEQTAPPFDCFQGKGSFTMFCPEPFMFSPAKIATVADSSSIVGTVRMNEMTINIAQTSSSLSLTNLTTGEQLRLNDSFVSGDVIKINFSTNSVTKNNTPIQDKVDFQKSTFKAFKFVLDMSLSLSGGATGTFSYNEVRL